MERKEKGKRNGEKEEKRKRKKKRRKALTSVPGLMSVFTGLHSKTAATEGGVDGRSMRPAPTPRHGTPSHPKHF